MSASSSYGWHFLAYLYIKTGLCVFFGLFVHQDRPLCMILVYLYIKTGLCVWFWFICTSRHAYCVWFRFICTSRHAYCVWFRFICTSRHAYCVWFRFICTSRQAFVYDFGHMYVDIAFLMVTDMLVRATFRRSSGVLMLCFRDGPSSTLLSSCLHSLADNLPYCGERRFIMWSGMYDVGLVGMEHSHGLLHCVLHCVLMPFVRFEECFIRVAPCSWTLCLKMEDAFFSSISRSVDKILLGPQKFSVVLADP